MGLFRSRRRLPATPFWRRIGMRSGTIPFGKPPTHFSSSSARLALPSREVFDRGSAMNRLRSTTWAVLAGLGLLSGCSSFGSSSGQGTGWFSRLMHRNSTCDCEMVGFGGMSGGCGCGMGGCGIGGCCDGGPDLGVPDGSPMMMPGGGAPLGGATFPGAGPGPMLPPAVTPNTIGPMPNLTVPSPQAAPLPAGPSSRRTGSTVSR